jgi:hypothetical protein
MKYTIVSANLSPDLAHSIRDGIANALALAGDNYFEIAATIWVFRTIPGYAGHAALAKVLRDKAVTFIQVSFDFPPLISIEPEKVLELQKFFCAD